LWCGILQKEHNESDACWCVFTLYLLFFVQWPDDRLTQSETCSKVCEREHKLCFDLWSIMLSLILQTIIMEINCIIIAQGSKQSLKIYNNTNQWAMDMEIFLYTLKYWNLKLLPVLIRNMSGWALRKLHLIDQRKVSSHHNHHQLLQQQQQQQQQHILLYLLFFSSLLKTECFEVRLQLNIFNLANNAICFKDFVFLFSSQYNINSLYRISSTRYWRLTDVYFMQSVF
jgi:hypothetical protein